MAIYKRGNTWWFEFVFNGERIRESTKQSNKRVAEQIEAARRTQLAKGEVGLEERKPVPTLEEFAPKFMDAIRLRSAEKPRTISFYQEKLTRLLDNPKLANARLDRIEEEMIESHIQKRRKSVSPASVNRELATLRRLLRLAYGWKIIRRVPLIRLLPGEHVREFVLDHAQEKIYLSAAPQPLEDVAILILDTGLRVGEALALTWKDISLESTEESPSGYLVIRDGKTRNAKRTISLSKRVKKMLTARLADAKTLYVFTSEDGSGPLSVFTIASQHSKLREAMKLPKDFVVHSLRHTMLTRLGEASPDVFALKAIAGHSTVTISQRYVHPSGKAQAEAMRKLEGLNARMDEKTKHDRNVAQRRVPTKTPTAKKRSRRKVI